MVNSADVRRVVGSEWQTLRDVRLAALADSPLAFASTYKREAAYDEQRWQGWVESGTWFLAWLGGRAVGIAAGVREKDRPDERHLIAMWVGPEQRGTAVATQLVDAVCLSALDEGARSITLWVADGNDRARRFYERLGFRLTGQRQPLPSAPDLGEERMQRTLGP